MNDKDKMHILNDILGEVKPMYLRQRVGARFIEFVVNKIPKGSMVLTEEEFNDFQEDSAKVKFLKKEIIKQAVKEFIQAINKEYELFDDEDEISFGSLRKDIIKIANDFGFL